MHCKQCRSLMVETRKEDSSHSHLSWYNCPTCGKIQLRSAKIQLAPALMHDDLGLQAEETQPHWASL